MAIDELSRTAPRASSAAGIAGALRTRWRSFVSGDAYKTDGAASAEQMAYAALLNVGMKAGLGAMVVCFVLYVSGIVPAHIPLEDLPRYWSMPVHEYIAATKAPTGWGWMRLVGKGDYLNILPVAFLATLTVACYARILPMLAAKRERIFAAIIVAEIAVLMLAISGILASGH